MRVAALYDVHGNLPALEAVLADVVDAEPDVVVAGGDMALGPFPAESLDALAALGERVVFLRGNADRELVAPAAPETGSIWEERRAFAADRLTAAHRRLLAGLPLTVALEVDGLGPTLFCHATPRSDEEIVTGISPDLRVLAAVGDVAEDVVVVGHTHVQFDRVVAGKRLVNAGSVGMPYEGMPGAYWALLGPGVDLRRTEYDLVAAAERIRESGFPGANELVDENVLASPDPDETTSFFEGLARES